VLPQWLAPLKLAAQGATVAGSVPDQQMSRLGDAVVSVDAPINVALRFDCDASGYRIARGEISTRVSLVCQRCVEDMDQQIIARVEWVAINDEALIENLPKQYDPWLLEEQGGDLYGMVEDEILLALPIVAFHNPYDCKGKKSYSTGNIESRKSGNPFEVLQKLKLPR
jgi:uncharacterized protein